MHTVVGIFILLLFKVVDDRIISINVQSCIFEPIMDLQSSKHLVDCGQKTRANQSNGQNIIAVIKIVIYQFN